MEPTEWEAESKRVCELIVWLEKRLREKEVCLESGCSPHCPHSVWVPDWVPEVAEETYGDPDKVHEATAILCELCRKTPDDIIYDGRDRTARRLADWWDDHQEADRAKAESEADEVRREELRRQAREKLSPEEQEAVGLE
jgi:hypothetical protein